MFRLCCRKARRIAEQDLRRSTHRLGGMDHAFMGCARLSLCGHLPTVLRRADGSRCNQDLGCWNFPRDIAHIGGSDQDLATGTHGHNLIAQRTIVARGFIHHGPFRCNILCRKRCLDLRGIGARQGAMFWSLVGRMLQGVMLIFRGEFADGAALVNALAPKAEAVGIQINFPLYRAALAMATIAQNRPDQAKGHSNWAVYGIAKTGEDKWAALIWKIYEYLENELQNPLNSKKAGSIASSYARRGRSVIWENYNISAAFENSISVI